MADNVTIIENPPENVIIEEKLDSIILSSPVAIGGGSGGGGGGGGFPIGEPRSTVLLAPNLSPGSSLTLNADAITSFLTGRLWAVSAQSSVSLRCDVQKVVSAARSNYDIIYKRAGDPGIWFAPDPRFFTAVGVSGGTTFFGVTVYNEAPIGAADIHVTIYWDETT